MIVPGHFTLWEAASPESTQAFLLVGTLVLLPVILFYTGWSYWGVSRQGSGGRGPLWCLSGRPAISPLIQHGDFMNVRPKQDALASAAAACCMLLFARW